MGYSTKFQGRVEVSPPLNAAEVAYLTAFNETRRWDRPGGPYDTSDAAEYANRARSSKPPEGQPHLYCPFVPTPDGTAIVWDQGEGSVYGAVEWMRYLIDHLLREEAIASQPLEQGWVRPREFDLFTFDHSCTGGFLAQGEEVGDVWSLLVRDNVVTHVQGHVKTLPHPGEFEAARPAARRPGTESLLAAAEETIREAAQAQKKALTPARKAMDDPRDDYTGMDPQLILNAVLTKLITAGYTVTAPDGKTQLKAPF